MANYYGNRGNGSSLRHYRTKGSRNGYSKNPNYKVVGQKAAGKLVNGRYIYDTGGGTKSGSRRPLTDYQQMARNEYLAQPGKKNNWQQQANYASAMGTAANNFNSGRISAYDDRGSQHRKYTDADGNRITVHNEHIGTASMNNGGNSHAYGVQMRKRIHELSQQGKKIGNGAKEQAYAMSNGHANTNDYSYQQQQAAYTNSKLNTAAGKLDMAKRKANVAMVNAKKKLQKWNPLNGTEHHRLSDPITGETVAEWDSRSKNKSKSKDTFTNLPFSGAQSYMQGARNNWQQQANAHRAVNEVSNNANTGKIHGFTGFNNSQVEAPNILNDGNKRFNGMMSDSSYANAIAKNNRNSPEYKEAMRKKVAELSAQGAKRNDGVADFQKRMALQEQAERERGRYRPLASPNYEQQEYARKQKTLKGRLDLAKRAANVAMVNAKKKLQKWNPLNGTEHHRLSDPITGETVAEWDSRSKNKSKSKDGPKTKAMTTGTTLYSNGPGGPITYSYSSGHGYTPSANGGLIGHLTANMLNTHAPTSNVHAVGGQNQQHTGNAKRQQEAAMRRTSAKGAKNDWQKQAASAQANAIAANRVNSGQSQAANVQENKKGFMGILKDKRKTYQMSNKTNKIIGDYVSKKKTESKLTAAEQRRKDEKKAKKIVKKGKKKLNKLLSYMNKETK